jgi:predicted membrane-bound dolichyl-phosphate-mannose-protein mannosyltransferase
MLDVFSVAFALAGLRRVRRGDTGLGSWMAWAMLGLAMACKWSAAPYCVLALLWAQGPVRARAAGIAVAVLAYVVPFLPLALLAHDPTPITRIAAYQLRMLDGFRSVDLAQHPYASRFWQWPTLLRPIWYHFEQTSRGERSIWAGGNPLLYALALPATVWIAVRAARREAAPVDRTIALLYWSPLLFWAALPRFQLFYYFLPSSLWAGPAVVRAALQLSGRRRRLAQVAIVVLTAACVALFLWFSPILDGRLEPAGTFARYMWLPRWR